MKSFKDICQDVPSLFFPEALGTEIIVEFFECSCEHMSDTEMLKSVYGQATKESNLTVVNEHYHKFEPQGVSLCITLAESSIGTHTYPEYAYAAINLFYCGKQVEIDRCIQVLFEFYQPKRILIKSFPRGLF